MCQERGFCFYTNHYLFPTRFENGVWNIIANIECSVQLGNNIAIYLELLNTGVDYYYLATKCQSPGN